LTILVSFAKKPGSARNPDALEKVFTVVAVFMRGRQQTIGMKKIYDDAISDIISENIPDDVSDTKGPAFCVFGFVKANATILGLAKTLEFSKVAATANGFKTVRVQLDELE
jgi:hypothetical protein